MILYKFIKRFCPDTYERIKLDERMFYQSLGVFVRYKNHDLLTPPLIEGKLPVNPKLYMEAYIETPVQVQGS